MKNRNEPDTDEANRRRLSAPGLRTFLAIANLWGLTEEQRRLILGWPSRSTYCNWVKMVSEQGALTLDADVLTRISATLGIHQALGALFPTEVEQVDWLRGPHKATVFGGQPPLALVINGSKCSLLIVRRFLDAARGGLYMPPNDVDRGFQPDADVQIVDASAPPSASSGQASGSTRRSFRKGEHNG